METLDGQTAVSARAAEKSVVVHDEGNGTQTLFRESPSVSLPALPLPARPTQWTQEYKGILLTTVGVAALAVGAFWLRSASKPVAPTPGPVPVTVQTIFEQKVRLWSEFPGRLQAVDYAEIRPQINGRITQVRFEDGQMVKKGDVLFVIEPEPFAAALARAQSNADFARTEMERADKLVQAQAIAQRQYDERVNASRVAEAELTRAKVDFTHAYVVAPISGRASRPEITVGNLVQSLNPPLLTSIVSNRGIYADFQMDEQTYLQSIRGAQDDENNEESDSRKLERTVPIELVLPGDSSHPYKGTIYSFDNHIDTVSGTIRARAKFDNEDGRLLPGMFVTVRTGGTSEVETVLVPERAIGIDQSKKFVYVVAADNKVGFREVTLGKSVGSNRVVLTGLKAGERVIVDGTQHLRPNTPVDPKEAAPASPTAV